ncbi:hypothetical protein EDC94DRAFT_652923 [Helicostylum pulchrum]|nr:hypothetical protein EDC94DRAFT_652923 [Helicostylum pulchrum]
MMFDAAGDGTGGGVFFEDFVGVVDIVEVIVGAIFGIGGVIVGTMVDAVGGGTGGGESVKDHVGIFFDDFWGFKEEGFNFLAVEAAEATEGSTEGSIEELFSDSFLFCAGTSFGSAAALVFFAAWVL